MLLCMIDVTHCCAWPSLTVYAGCIFGLVCVICQAGFIQVTNISVDSVGTGIMGKLGNKGGVGVR